LAQFPAGKPPAVAEGLRRRRIVGDSQRPLAVRNALIPVELARHPAGDGRAGHRAQLAAEPDRQIDRRAARVTRRSSGPKSSSLDHDVHRLAPRGVE
jgi:hypothetical protein